MGIGADTALVIVEIVAVLNLSKITASLREDILIGVGVNNSSIASEDGVLGGNGTDRALMSFLVSNGLAKSINKEEVVTFNAFDSNKKCSSIVVNHGGSTRIYIKGAPERIIDRCKKYVDSEGQEQPLEDTARINAYLNEQATLRYMGKRNDYIRSALWGRWVRELVTPEFNKLLHDLSNMGNNVKYLRDWFFKHNMLPEGNQCKEILDGLSLVLDEARHRRQLADKENAEARTVPDQWTDAL